MSVLSEADRFLLEQVRAGDERGWAQLVERYEGRLLAFARGRLRQRADAEDLVQDTFLSFLRGLKTYRELASIETYLFTILRRKIIDVFRGKSLAACSLSELSTAGHDGGDAPLTAMIASDAPTASWYVRRDEDRAQSSDALAAALRSMVDEFKGSLRFRDLQLAELLFYAQLRNKDIAELPEMTEQQVAMFKHRWIKRVRERVGTAGGDVGAADDAPADGLADTMLTRVWEEHRFSCPKRSTIGAMLLGTLDDDWREYVEFHLKRLGCRFCVANLQDLETQVEAAQRQRIHRRIFESTVGFLKAT